MGSSFIKAMTSCMPGDSHVTSKRAVGSHRDSMANVDAFKAYLTDGEEMIDVPADWNIVHIVEC